MSDPILIGSLTFQGSLYRVHLDHEGESRVTFAIPLSDLKNVLTLGQFTQKLLTVSVKVDQ